MSQFDFLSKITSNKISGLGTNGRYIDALNKLPGAKKITPGVAKFVDALSSVHKMGDELGLNANPDTRRFLLAKLVVMNSETPKEATDLKTSDFDDKVYNVVYTDSPANTLDLRNDRFGNQHPPVSEYYESASTFNTELRSRNIAKTFRFHVEMTTPAMLEGFVVDEMSAFQYTTNTSNQRVNTIGTFSVETVSMPGFSFDIHPVNHGGWTTNLPVGYIPDTCAITFRCFGDMGEKLFFDKWAHSIFNFASGGMKFFDDYVSQIRIYQTDESGNRVYGVLLQNAYPTNVSSIDYAQADSDYTKVTVTFTLERIKPILLAHTDTDVRANEKLPDQRTIPLKQSEIVRKVPSTPGLSNVQKTI